jgi:hypothetical protein
VAQRTPHRDSPVKYHVDAARGRAACRQSKLGASIRFPFAWGELEGSLAADFSRLATLEGLQRATWDAKACDPA